MPNLNSHLRSRIGKVCAALTDSTTSGLIEKAATAAREISFLEFRLDYLDAAALKHPTQTLAPLKQFLAEHTAVTAIATCRLTGNGGKFAGNAQQALAILTEAAASGFHIVDVELETAETLPAESLRKLREAGTGLIVSHHNFDSTGSTDDLEAIARRIAVFTPDFVKIVPTARTLADNVTLLRFIQKLSDTTSVIGICMGEAGLISRVLGLRFGAAFTFAAANSGEETAAGQIAARALIEAYRIEDIDPSTKVYGVAGDPVSKSLSPLMMNTAFRRETVNAVYLALPTADVADLVSVIRDIPFQGVSVTMPHKQAILPHLEHTDPLSAKIGAVNTVLRVASPGEKPKLYGFNTDVQGITVPLEKRITLKGAKILVLGAGGSARAAVFGLRDKAAEVFILARNPDAAAKLAKQSGAKVIKREALPKSSFDAIINATPVGMAGNTGEQILTAADFQAGLKARYVFDMVYNPVETPLLRLARQVGIPVITGVEMFVQQGARQFEIWTGKPAPEEEMLKVVIHALRQAGDPAQHEPAPPPVAEAPEPEFEAEPELPVPPPSRKSVKPLSKKESQKPAARKSS